MRSQLLAVSLMLLSLGIGASAQTLSNDQLNQLKNLTPEQQDALMQTLTGKSGAVTKTDQRLSMPQTVQPKTDQTDLSGRYPRDKTRDGRTLRLPGEDPELHADDTVLIDLTPLEIRNRNYNQNYPNGN